MNLGELVTLRGLVQMMIWCDKVTRLVIWRSIGDQRGMNEATEGLQDKKH